MSLYVFDTDSLTLHQLGNPLVRQRASRHAPSELATTVITVEEQLSGWYSKVRQAKKRDDLARAYQHLADQVSLLTVFQVLAFPVPAILRYEQLKTSRLNIGKKDLCIAAITLENNATLVTRNLRDFQRVPGLTIENWAV